MIQRGEMNEREREREREREMKTSERKTKFIYIINVLQTKLKQTYKLYITLFLVYISFSSAFALFKYFYLMKGGGCSNSVTVALDPAM